MNDFLDVQPVTDISKETFWKTASDARAAMNAAYGEMQQAYRGDSGANYFHWFETRSDSWCGGSNGGKIAGPINNNQFDASKNCCDWNRFYKAISQANYAIHFIPKLENVDKAAQNHLLAEAYFLRAWMYFQIVLIWQDAPKITEPVLSLPDVTKPARAPQSELNQLIGEDLAKAVECANPGAAYTSAYLFSNRALYCLYADYAMWIKDYGLADTYTEKVLTSFGVTYPYKTGAVTGSLTTPLTSGDNFRSMFSTSGQATSENIFSLKWDYANQGYNPVAYTMNRDDSPDIAISPSLGLRWMDPKYRQDKRRFATIDTTKNWALTGSGSAPKMYYGDIPGGFTTWKWASAPIKAARPDMNNQLDLPVYRLADMYLLRAEALNKLGNMDDALILLNAIRDRAGVNGKMVPMLDANGLPTYDDRNQTILTLDPQFYKVKKETLDPVTGAVIHTLTMDELEDIILDERQLELVGEGKRWRDLVRTGKARSTMNKLYTTVYPERSANPTLYDESEAGYWMLGIPIKTDNIVENDNLKQNGLY